ncbi:MAG: Cell surface protein [Candidatus Jettenia ecosi]|uniref:Cell surface protein n=1 Tax=Candidatus Jettenia ecosi TaxID=2494326 RepID=A0A533QEC6_9BACT|nr:MAG: Cell surface protein [Candidatus Jettenia ecosi]
MNKNMMKRIGKWLIIPIILLQVVLFSKILFAEQEGTRKLSKGEVIQKVQKFHVPFIANNGQIDDRVKFYANTFCGTVFVTREGEIIYSLTEVRDRAEKNKDMSKVAGSHRSIVRRGVFKEEIIKGKMNEIKGEGKAITKVSSFKGKDSSKWKGSMSTYELVNLGEVYKGIDLKLRAYANNVEKLFYVRPGANPEQIKIRLDYIQSPESPFAEGNSIHNLFYKWGMAAKSPLKSRIRGFTVNKHGELETALGTVLFTKPVAYQEIDGKRVEIVAEYSIRKSEYRSQNPGEKISQLIYGFKVASYDRTKELVIDPLLASTFLGGSSLERINSIAVDSGGNIYIAGETISPDFPLAPGIFDATHNGSFDVFVSKVDGTLTTLLASTFLGGSDGERADSLVIDPNGNISISGSTNSSNFPVIPGSFDTSFHGNSDVFVSKLDGTLTNLLASTYLGGFGREVCDSLMIDQAGNVYVAGSTSSLDFPITPEVFDTSFSGGGDVFISKLNGTLTNLLASTYLGGSALVSEELSSTAIDAAGNIYVAGATGSSDFPTTPGAFDTSYNGNFDVFVSRLSGELTTLLSSTFLGGFEADSASSLSINPEGNMYVTGLTSSFDFPVTSGAFDSSFNGGVNDVFVSKLDGTLTLLLASTYLGGSDSDSSDSLVVDLQGNIYVTGSTASLNFPTTLRAFDTSHNGFFDIFISKMDKTLTNLLTSTYVGGSSGDGADAFVIDSSGNLYIAGSTGSSDFPITSGSFDTSFNGVADAFISKLNSDLSALITFNYFYSKAKMKLGPQANDDNFDMWSTFVLGDASDGIDLLSDDIYLQVGTLSISIPSGSFKNNKNKHFKFKKIINGVALQLTIVPSFNKKSFEFKAEVKHANLTGTADPINMQFTIGNDGGSTIVAAEPHKLITTDTRHIP